MARSSVLALAMVLSLTGIAEAAALPSVAGAVLIRRPGAADAAAMPGSATLRILARGGERVREAALDASSGDAAFDAEALSAVRRWRYVPALTGNSSQPEWLLVRLVRRAKPPARLARAAGR